jgi:ribosomal protein S18 acetylase RimI-like enzyme
MSPPIAFRPIRADDEEFLSNLYASTRTEELAQVQWSDAEKRQFLEMQFAAQHRYYQEQFPDAECSILLLDGDPIGRLYVDRRDDEIRILDIALLPESRNAGIGGVLIGELLEEARRLGVPVRIHVEQFNPALRLYQRLGFRKIGETGVHHLMEWEPAPTS